MLKKKLSHIAVSDAQLELLQKSAYTISSVTGQDIETVEGAMVSLLARHAGNEAICSLSYHLMLAEKGDTVCGICHTLLRA